MQLLKTLKYDLLQFFNVSFFLIVNLLKDFIMNIKLVWKVFFRAFSKYLQK